MYETFLSQPMFVMVRFGKWDEMLTEPKPDLESQFMTRILNYGRALAYIHTDRPAMAKRELHPLSAAREAMGIDCHQNLRYHQSSCQHWLSDEINENHIWL